MDKLPCSTSFLMSINFDGLKEVIEFFHKNMNIMNDKINDINKKFKGYEDIQNQMKENKIKTESGLRLLNELEQTINSYSLNIMDNSKKISINKDNLEVLKEDIEKIKLDNKNLSSEVKELYTELNQINKSDDNKKNENSNENILKTEINKIRGENKENFDELIKKIDELDIKIKDIENNKEKINDINEKNENDIKEKEENKNENINNIILYQDLSKRVGQLEEKINKMPAEINHEIILPNQNKITEIKNSPFSNAENKLEEEINNNNNNILVSNYDDRLNKIDSKLSKLENDILSLQINNNKDENQNHSSLQDEKSINNNKLNNNENEKNDEINQKEEKDYTEHKENIDKEIQNRNHRQQRPQQIQREDALQNRKGEQRRVQPGQPFDLYRDDQEQQKLHIRVQHGEREEQREIHITGSRDSDIMPGEERGQNAHKEGQNHAGEIIEVEFRRSPLPFQRGSDHVIEIEEEEHPDRVRDRAVSGHKDERNQTPDLPMENPVPVKGQKTDGGGVGKDRQNVHYGLSDHNHAHEAGNAKIRVPHDKAVHSGIEFFQGNPPVD